MQKRKIELIVTDIDNTVFDWITYYVHSFEALIKTVSSVIGTDEVVLKKEASQVFEAERSTEYPFLIQELPSVNRYYGDDVDRMLQECVEPGRKAFLEVAGHHLILYSDVQNTFERLRREKPNIPIVALTDAPRYIAMWKLNKLKLLPYFDAVYGLGDPRIPVNEVSKKVKVDQEILVKHLQRSNFGFTGKVRTLPDEYEKPGVRGFKTILMDYGFEDLSRRKEVLWIGDHPVKDINLGHAMGVTTCFAVYGNSVSEDLKQRLMLFGAPSNVRRNAALAENPTRDDCYELSSYAGLLDIIT